MAEGSIEICDPPSGYVDNTDDCDDGERTVHPDAAEICDDVDNDCDGLLDDEDDPISGTSTYYYDGDLDGFGDAATTADLCEAHSGYIEDDSDCDDSDAAIHPSAEEYCDLVDDDCDGLFFPCVGSLADGFVLTGEAAGDYAGWSVAVVGDSNNDGYEDILVGAYCEDSGGTSAGAVYLLQGPLTGSGSLADASVKLTGIRDFDIDGHGDNLGYAVSGAGDVNADGYGDLVIGAISSGDERTGAAYVWLGPVTDDATISEADGSLFGVSSLDYAGWAVAGGADVNGDGYDDVLVGAQPADAAYLVLGQASAFGSVSLSDAAASFTSEPYGGSTGYDLALGGDTNGDGYEDMLLGDISYGSSFRTQSGAAYLVLGSSAPSGGSLDIADVGIYGQSSGDWVGHGLACDGDVDGDGYDDLLLGAKGDDVSASNEGSVYVFAGPVSSGADLSTATAQLCGEDADDNAGYRVSYAGDMDGDGSDDILVGAKGAELDVSGEGVAYIVLGPVTGTISLSNADAILASGSSGAEATRGLAGGADTDADGLPEILVGAPYDDTSDTDAGAAYLLEPDWF